jgi:hypothetical protein
MNDPLQERIPSLLPDAEVLQSPHPTVDQFITVQSCKIDMRHCDLFYKTWRFLRRVGVNTSYLWNNFIQDTIVTNFKKHCCCTHCKKYLNIYL